MLGPTIGCRGRIRTGKQVQDRRLHIGICVLTLRGSTGILQ
jgi:hypothetical protein